MKFTVATHEFIDALRIAAHGVTPSNATPILENILIQASEKKVKMTANNLEMSVEYTFEKSVRVEEVGETTINYRFLGSYLPLVESDEVTVSLGSGETLTFEAGGSRSKYKGLPASDFPVVPSVQPEVTIKIEGDKLKPALGKTLFSCANGAVRPALAGVYLSVDDDTIKFASTDSFRLSEYATPNAINIDQPISIIIPFKTASEIYKIITPDDLVELQIASNHISVLFGEAKMSSRLLSGRFPDYHNFFPQAHNTKAVVKRGSLIRALKQVNLISKENNFNTKMFFESGKVILDTGDTQIGAGKNEVPAEVEGMNDSIGVNSTYTIDCLNAINQEYVQIEFETNLAPVLVRGIEEDGSLDPNYRHIVMPLKI